MIASDVITEARFALSDENAERWTDTRLLSLLNNAIKDVALRTKLFNRRTYVKILDEVVLYDISAFALQIRRVEFDEQRIPFRSHEEMDNLGRNSNNSRYSSVTSGNSIHTGFNDSFDGGKDWKKHKGSEPSAIIYDKQDFGKFTMYPMIENANFDHLDANSSFGLITNITYEDLELIPNDVVGDLNPPNIKNYFYIYYVARHTVLTAVSDVLDISEFYKELLSYYVTSKALIDNIDTQNREMGSYYRGLYEERLANINEITSTNNTESQPTTTYRSME